MECLPMNNHGVISPSNSGWLGWLRPDAIFNKILLD